MCLTSKIFLWYIHAKKNKSVLWLKLKHFHAIHKAVILMLLLNLGFQSDKSIKIQEQQAILEMWNATL